MLICPYFVTTTFACVSIMAPISRRKSAPNIVRCSSGTTMKGNVTSQPPTTTVQFDLPVIRNTYPPTVCTVNEHGLTLLHKFLSINDTAAPVSIKHTTSRSFTRNFEYRAPFSIAPTKSRFIRKKEQALYRLKFFLFRLSGQYLLQCPGLPHSKHRSFLSANFNAATSRCNASIFCSYSFGFGWSIAATVVLSSCLVTFASSLISIGCVALTSCNR
uniref:Uncharacterized protein n=2 Tax=Trichobilharzia regenti TaxID=157069 RepID=A0AA85JM13_TRIRE|nr:unnamed protein product [Trichobilharzia regenti]CAH8876604.1 unnamed protein product [Trichobilharzia regenti]